MPRKQLQAVLSDEAEEEAAPRWLVRPTVGQDLPCPGLYLGHGLVVKGTLGE